MIVRSGAQLQLLFDRIRACEFLGAVDEQQLASFQHEFPNLHIKQNPEDCLGITCCEGTVPLSQNVFGFWLPHGLGDVSTGKLGEHIRDCMSRFNIIEAAYREAEGVKKEVLWLESEQAQLFEERPDLLPGAKLDTTIKQETVDT